MTSFSTAPGDVLLDLVNTAKNEVFEMFEWDFDKRHDGIVTTIAPLTYASAVGTCVATNGSATVAVVGVTDYTTITAGESRSHIAITSDASFGATYFGILTGRHPTTSDSYVIETEWPGTTIGLADTSAVSILTADYVLPATVRDVLSVMVEEQQVALGFVDKVHDIDDVIPNRFDTTSDVPEVCYVGGTLTPTEVFGDTATLGLGLMLYPAPSEVYTVRYSYRYRHPQLSATTDTVEAHVAVVDCIVDKAVAKAYRSAVANDPEMAQQIELDVARRLVRLSSLTSPTPARHASLKSHDRIGGVTQFGSRPSNPRNFGAP